MVKVILNAMMPSGPSGSPGSSGSKPPKEPFFKPTTINIGDAFTGALGGMLAATAIKITDPGTVNKTVNLTKNYLKVPGGPLIVSSAILGLSLISTASIITNKNNNYGGTGANTPSGGTNFSPSPAESSFLENVVGVLDHPLLLLWNLLELWIFILFFSFLLKFLLSKLNLSKG